MALWLQAVAAAPTLGRKAVPAGAGDAFKDTSAPEEPIQTLSSSSPPAQVLWAKLDIHSCIHSVNKYVKLHQAHSCHVPGPVLGLEQAGMKQTTNVCALRNSYGEIHGVSCDAKGYGEIGEHREVKRKCSSK